MSGCNFPNKMFPTGYLTENGKTEYLMATRDTKFIYKPTHAGVKSIHANRSHFYNDIKIHDYIEVPCGKCVACRLNYSKNWANRCMMEAQYHEHNYFLTFTYDNENVHVNDNTGVLTLHVPDDGEKDDLQTCLNKINTYYKRRHGNEPLKFFSCGEYGDQTERPHYHSIAFGLDVKDLEFLKYNKQGEPIYISKELRDIWGKGNITVEEVTWNTCAYVARYVTKKQKGTHSNEYYESIGQKPPFARMSEGIGKRYFEEHKGKIYEEGTDEILIKRKKFNMNATWKTFDWCVESVKPPRYFDTLFERENPELMAEIKENRQRNAEERKKLLMSMISKNEVDLGIQQEEQLNHRAKLLERALE